MQIDGHDSFIAFGRLNNQSTSRTLQIGSRVDTLLHGVASILFDRHGFSSRKATYNFVQEIDSINPDLIHLHNLHGYYLHIGELFRYIKKKDIPAVWTLHDSWSYTGHCTFYESVNCEKWQSQCQQCPKKNFYPSSYGLDQSKRNYLEKISLYSELHKLHLVTPSKWLAHELEKSFLRRRPVHVIHNGVDLDVFKPKFEEINNNSRKIVLGVASIWDTRKGLDDFIKLRKLLPNDFDILLIGLSKRQLNKVPKGIYGISRTENVHQLADYYNEASVFVNPTIQDNFPTTNLEALACGTPVITYNTGGSPEAVDHETGIVVPKGDVGELAWAIEKVIRIGKDRFQENCRKRALDLFNKDDRYLDYINLYKQIINKHQV